MSLCLNELYPFGVKSVDENLQISVFILKEIDILTAPSFCYLLNIVATRSILHESSKTVLSFKEL